MNRKILSPFLGGVILVMGAALASADPVVNVESLADGATVAPTPSLSDGWTPDPAFDETDAQITARTAALQRELNRCYSAGKVFRLNPNKCYQTNKPLIVPTSEPIPGLTTPILVTLSSSNTTTIQSTTPVFTNAMKGCVVQVGNTNGSQIYTIISVTSSTAVVVDRQSGSYSGQAGNIHAIFHGEDLDFSGATIVAAKQTANHQAWAAPAGTKAAVVVTYAYQWWADHIPGANTQGEGVPVRLHISNLHIDGGGVDPSKYDPAGNADTSQYLWPDAFIWALPYSRDGIAIWSNAAWVVGCDVRKLEGVALRLRRGGNGFVGQLKGDDWEKTYISHFKASQIFLGVAVELGGDGVMTDIDLERMRDIGLWIMQSSWDVTNIHIAGTQRPAAANDIDFQCGVPHSNVPIITGTNPRPAGPTLLLPREYCGTGIVVDNGALHFYGQCGLDNNRIGLWNKASGTYIQNARLWMRQGARSNGTASWGGVETGVICDGQTTIDFVYSDAMGYGDGQGPLMAGVTGVDMHAVKCIVKSCYLQCDSLAIAFKVRQNDCEIRGGYVVKGRPVLFGTTSPEFQASSRCRISIMGVACDSDKVLKLNEIGADNVFTITGYSSCFAVLTNPVDLNGKTPAASNSIGTPTPSTISANLIQGTIGNFASVNSSALALGPLVNQTGLAGWWTFDEPTGSTFADSSINARTGTGVNATPGTLGNIAQCVVIGNGASVKVGAWDPGTTFTVGVWARLDNPTLDNGTTHQKFLWAKRGDALINVTGLSCNGATAPNTVVASAPVFTSAMVTAGPAVLTLTSATGTIVTPAVHITTVIDSTHATTDAPTGTYTAGVGTIDHFGLEGGSYFCQWGIESLQTGAPSMFIQSGATGAIYRTIAMPATGIWHYYAMTVAGTTVKFYVDGLQQGVDITGFNLGTLSTNQIFFGSESNGTAESWAGALDDATIYTRALSLGEIQAQMQLIKYDRVAGFSAGRPTGGGSGGAPTTATYITETADATLSAEFALGSLATGILKNTTTTGVPSIAAAGTDYVAPGGALGTPSSGTLTSCTGLPISTGVSGLGTGVATAATVAANAVGGIRTVNDTSRNNSQTSTATLAPNANTWDVQILTAQAVGLTVAADAGTPVAGQRLIVRIKDNGTAQTIAWNAQYRDCGATPPVTTTISKTIYVGFLWNATDSKWDCVALSTQP